MILIETSRGLVEASRLEVREESRDVATGRLSTKSYLLNGEVVKIDQHLDIAEGVLAIGTSDL